MEYSRFSVQILGTVDAMDTIELHQSIKSALQNVAKFKVKMIGLDEWVDGLGETRRFDKNGVEILPQPVQPTISEQLAPEELLEIEEVTL